MASMARLIEILRQLAGLTDKDELSGRPGASADLPPVGKVLDEDAIKKLMQMIEQTDEREYSCEEAFSLIDEYVELAVDKQDAAILMPLVKKHIDMCVDCRDVYETLMRILQSDSASTAV
jgi:hypothetical protein